LKNLKGVQATPAKFMGSPGSSTKESPGLVSTNDGIESPGSKDGDSSLSILNESPMEDNESPL